jgi:pimeloyl-ACP methyl ester carboxylesterase
VELKPQRAKLFAPRAPVTDLRGGANSTVWRLEQQGAAMSTTSPPIGGFEERIIATADGLALYLRDYAPLAPTTGLPVICLHGLTRNSRDFEAIAPRIAACGRRVLVPDMRGRGRSANDPDPSHYAPPVYVQDVLAMLDKMEVARAVFVGTSMGGIISMVAAAMAPDRVAAAALNDVGVRIDPAGIERIAAYVGRTRAVESWRAAAEAVRSIAGSAYPGRLGDEDFWLAFARRTFRERQDGMIEPDYDPAIALAFADANSAAPADMTPLFQALAVKPVLVVRGALSDILAPETVAAMRAIKPDLETVEVDNVGHAPMLDEPEAWEALLTFLAKAP